MTADKESHVERRQRLGQMSEMEQNSSRHHQRIRGVIQNTSVWLNSTISTRDTILLRARDYVNKFPPRGRPVNRWWQLTRVLLNREAVNHGP